MAMLRALVSVALVALLMELAMAANYTVGAPNGGWDLMTPLQAWANSQNFSVGDSLNFVYTLNHDVLEVSRPDYDACQTNKPVASYNGGMTVITLSSSGNRYFICGSQGHCDRGMKMVITTLGASAPPPATPAVPPPAGTPSAPAPAIPSAPLPATPSGSPKTSPPVSSPAPSPPSKTTAPVHAPKKAPTASLSKSPATSPASSPSTSAAESPAIPPFPATASPPTTPSSSSKINVSAGLTIGFATVIMMLLTL